MAPIPQVTMVTPVLSWHGSGSGFSGLIYMECRQLRALASMSPMSVWVLMAKTVGVLLLFYFLTLETMVTWLHLGAKLFQLEGSSNSG